METTCLECGRPVTIAATGRPRLYCSRRCRQAAGRRSQKPFDLEAVTHLETVGTAHGTLPEPAHPDEQVVQALVTARVLAGSFVRLGREARPQLAWRCRGVGEALNVALHRYFKEMG